MRKLPFAPLAALAVLVVSRLAGAEGLRADLVDAKSIKLDGVPKEWTGLVPLSTVVKGTAKKPDLEAKAAVAYDAQNIFVGADVIDDVLKPGIDHVELVLGFPGGTTQEIELYPGDPGKSPGSAKAKDGSAIL